VTRVVGQCMRDAAREIADQFKMVQICHAVNEGSINARATSHAVVVGVVIVPCSGAFDRARGIGQAATVGVRKL
jgi:hypothetical protein